MADDPFAGLDTVGVVTANGIGYVTAMLANLEAGRVSVPLRGPDDTERLSRTGASEFMAPPVETGWLDAPFVSRGGDEPAQISFTSGTEGKPKAVLLSRGALHDVVERLTAAMEIAPEIREYVGVPVYHSFGYGRCRIVLNAGGACYIPAGGFDLGEIRRMLRAGEINAVSAVPSLWRIFLAERDFFGDELAAVRWVEIGSQYMSAEEKKALRDCLPNARIVQHYGLTEASRATLLRIHSEPAENLASVGRAEGAVQVRINDRGRIEIKGPPVALGILDGDSWRRLGPDAWLETGDFGRLENGLLYYEGRADDIINCGGVKLSPDLIEEHLRRAAPDAGEFGVLRRPDPLRGDGIALVLAAGAAGSRDRLVEAICDYAANFGVAARAALTVHEVAALPRTDTGKLQRARLTRTLQDERKEPAEPAPEDGGGFAALLWPLFRGAPFDSTKTFEDMGGDSLLHMQVNLALERALGEAPPDWERTPLGELVDRVAAAGDFGSLMATGGGAPPLARGERNRNPDGVSFFGLVAEDYRTNDSSVFHQGFLMLLVHRFGNLRMDVRWKLLRAPLTLLYRILNKMTQIFFGMKLDYTVKVGRRVKLEHFGGMILGAREIGDDVFLRQNTTLGVRSTDDLNAKPVIGSFVDIGAGAVIVGNVRVGDNSVIGANTVVYTNVPPDSVVIGVPGRVIGRNPRRNPSPLKGFGVAPDAGTKP